MSIVRAYLVFRGQVLEFACVVPYGLATSTDCQRNRFIRFFLHFLVVGIRVDINLKIFFTYKTIGSDIGISRELRCASRP